MILWAISRLRFSNGISKEITGFVVEVIPAACG
jgi:hypothetical protein